MDVTAKVQSLLKEHLGLDDAQVQPDQHLSEHGVDSLAAVEFIFTLENAFGIRLPETGDLPDTVADLVEMVETALAGQEK